MKKLIVLLFIFPVLAHAQLEKVFVETYYISDTLDASDTTGGYLAPGSITYRIYIDLYPGSRLQKIYGDANHPLIFQSSDTVFNHRTDGQTFAKEFSKNRYGEGLVALDSWITIGQTSKNSSKTWFGVPKCSDRDGSLIGGANNDGGSAQISGGLLVNNHVDAGIPLTDKDGMDTLTSYPTIWADYGFTDLVSGADSTIFGSLVYGNRFISYQAGVFNSGAMGVIPDSNQILVAQITTKGTLAFDLNIEVIDSIGNLIKYVSSDSILLAGEVFSRMLKYPYNPVCGCDDPAYLEYMPNRDCNNPALCLNRIVYGCLDSMACNYDPYANFHVASLCCYPGYCNDRNIEAICPDLSVQRSQLADYQIYPNPVSNILNIRLNSPANTSCKIVITDLPGQIVFEKNVQNQQYIDCSLSDLNNGTYFVKVICNGITTAKSFIKQ